MAGDLSTVDIDLFQHGKPYRFAYTSGADPGCVERLNSLDLGAFTGGVENKLIACFKLTTGDCSSNNATVVAVIGEFVNILNRDAQG